MKVGIVSDIHCNVPGLVGALAALGGVDELLCLGDSIYGYRFSNEIVALLRSRDAHVILGNHEETFLGPSGTRARVQPWIDRGLLEWMSSQPQQRVLDMGGKRLLMVHSTPWTPRGEYVFPDSPQLQRFGEVDADFVLFGHTHMQLVQRIGPVLVVNPGSTGEARDVRNGRRLSCALLDTVSEEARIIDYEYARDTT